MSLFSKKIRVGIDLGSNSIKIIGLKQNADKLDIQFYELLNLIERYSLNSVKDVTDEHYIEQLRLLAEKYKLKNKEIAVTLPSHSALLRNIELAQSFSESEIADTIQTELEQICTDGLQNMRIAGHQSESHNDSISSMLVCALPNEQLERFTKILDSAGLDVIVVGIDALEILNAFHYFHKQQATSPITVIHTGQSHTICINLSENTDPFFHIFTVENESESGAAEDNTSEMYEIETTDEPTHIDLDFLRTDRSKTVPEFEAPIVKEIKKYRNHVQTCQGANQVGVVYLTGELANANNLSAELRKSFKAEVKIWNPFEEITNLVNRGPIGQQFPAALGSAIREVN